MALTPDQSKRLAKAVRQILELAKAQPMQPMLPKVPSMSLKDFHGELERHDWHHMMSDDSRVHHKGESNMRRLQAIAQQSPEHKQLLNSFHTHKFTGPNFGTPQQPKPEKPADS